MSTDTNFKVMVEVKVVDLDGQIVDHRGYTPRKGVGLQSCTTEISGHKDITEANQMMNAIHAIVDTISELKDIKHV